MTLQKLSECCDVRLYNPLPHLALSAVKDFL